MAMDALAAYDRRDAAYAALEPASQPPVAPFHEGHAGRPPGPLPDGTEHVAHPQHSRNAHVLAHGYPHFHPHAARTPHTSVPPTTPPHPDHAYALAETGTVGSGSILATRPTPGQRASPYALPHQSGRNGLSRSAYGNESELTYPRHSLAHSGPGLNPHHRYDHGHDHGQGRGHDYATQGHGSASGPRSVSPPSLMGAYAGVPTTAHSSYPSLRPSVTGPPARGLHDGLSSGPMPFARSKAPSHPLHLASPPSTVPPPAFPARQGPVTATTAAAATAAATAATSNGKQLNSKDVERRARSAQRNREAQRAFRQRRDAYIKTLEARAGVAEALRLELDAARHEIAYWRARAEGDGAAHLKRGSPSPLPLPLPLSARNAAAYPPLPQPLSPSQRAPGPRPPPTHLHGPIATPSQWYASEPAPPPPLPSRSPGSAPLPHDGYTPAARYQRRQRSPSASTVSANAPYGPMHYHSHDGAASVAAAAASAVRPPGPLRHYPPTDDRSDPSMPHDPRPLLHDPQPSLLSLTSMSLVQPPPGPIRSGLSDATTASTTTAASYPAWPSPPSQTFPPPAAASHAHDGAASGYGSDLSSGSLSLASNSGGAGTGGDRLPSIALVAPGARPEPWLARPRPDPPYLAASWESGRRGPPPPGAAPSAIPPSAAAGADMPAAARAVLAAPVTDVIGAGVHSLDAVPDTDVKPSLASMAGHATGSVGSVSPTPSVSTSVARSVTSHA
ncbi:hypothetical protein CXG81DRAFT_17317 [Caulochytrium protostelioides]|uniref:BZIP domain-containing protein n=1 Tax=Caulochytrium protostelioides TaxID=1555241 RepID=A0A4P9XCA8_9FUNG|nr:hypothetical protein CXG81DRAFT_17317 [Caulochytrium protostelioides]|eukprot:RKP03055.1 hypothetical protein CXG81DRAFT_17317 [Caulochytrium protostelioides]